MENCVFCKTEEMLSEALYETENFFVRIGIGIITAGHVMLISKKHFPAMAALPAELEKEYFELKAKLAARIAKEFSKPCMVEYGNWAQSIPHAHVHFVPLKNSEYEVKNIVDEMVRKGDNNIEEVTWERLREIYRKEGGYASFEQDGKLYAVHPQRTVDEEFATGNSKYIFIRQFFTYIKGVEGADGWKTLSDEDKEIDKVKRKITKQKLTRPL